MQHSAGPRIVPTGTRIDEDENRKTPKIESRTVGYPILAILFSRSVVACVAWVWKNYNYYFCLSLGAEESFDSKILIPPKFANNARRSTADWTILVSLIKSVVPLAILYRHSFISDRFRFDPVSNDCHAEVAIRWPPLSGRRPLDDPI